MKDTSFSSLNAIDSEYSKIVASISERYKCDWNDSIHDSYQRYVKQVEEYSQRIHGVRCKAETLQKEVEELRIDELRENAQSLCKEAERL